MILHARAIAVVLGAHAALNFAMSGVDVERLLVSRHGDQAIGAIIALAARVLFELEDHVFVAQLLPYWLQLLYNLQI